MRSYDTCNTFSCNEKKNMRGGTEQNKAASFRTTKKLFSHVNSLRTTLLHNSENGFRTVAEAELGLLLPLHKRFLFICYAYVLLPCVCVCRRPSLSIPSPNSYAYMVESLTMYSIFRPLWRQLPNTRHFSIPKSLLSYITIYSLLYCLKITSISLIWDESEKTELFFTRYFFCEYNEKNMRHFDLFTTLIL